jgi:hypothetical protein
MRVSAQLSVVSRQLSEPLGPDETAKPLRDAKNVKTLEEVAKDVRTAGKVQNPIATTFL